MKRNEQLKSIRPGITVDGERYPLPQEHFQNEVLRPVLKFQNEWILQYFKGKTGKLAIPKSEDKQMLFIENLLRKDTIMRNQLIGSIIGLFSEEELALYLKDTTAVNKRIVKMLVVRIYDQLSSG